MKTVGELKRLLETLDEDMLIVTNSSSLSKQGALIEGIRGVIDTYKKTRKTFIDAYDYTKYSAEVYEPDKNGVKCLYLF